MSTIEFADFQRLDLRVGKILEAERIPEKKKIYKLQIDIGKEHIQTIAGGAEYYSPEYSVGRKIVVLLNLQPKTIAGIQSTGMLLAADLQGGWVCSRPCLSLSTQSRLGLFPFQALSSNARIV
jgi:methionine--tRNA ligase beta chain